MKRKWIKYENSGPATAEQLEALEELGYTGSTDISEWRAFQFLDTLIDVHFIRGYPGLFPKDDNEQNI